METLDIGEGTETAIHISVRRTWDGVLVHAKVHPIVEQFFERWSGGAQDIVQNFGRQWKAIGGGVLPTAWKFRDPDTEDRGSYTIHTLGGPLILDEDGPSGIINISFLRLVGASQESGITIVIDTLISKKRISEISAKLFKAVEAFYADYLQPLYFGVDAVVKVREGR